MYSKVVIIIVISILVILLLRYIRPRRVAIENMANCTGPCIFGQGCCQTTTNIRNENNTNIISRSDISVLSTNINEFITTTTTDMAKSCSNTVLAQQSIDFSGSTISGGFVMNNNTLTQDATVTFNCLQESTVRNDTSLKLLQTMMQGLVSTISPEVLVSLDNTAKQKNQDQALSFSGSTSNMNIENIMNYTQISETYKNLENVVKNSIEANFKTTDVQNCLNQTVASQSITATGTTISGGVNISNNTFAQQVSTFANCIQKSDIGNKIVNDIVKNLDIKVEDIVTPTVTNNVKNTTEQESAQVGLLQSFGAAISEAAPALAQLTPIGALNNITSKLGSGGSTTVVISSVSLSSCLCCCIILALVFFMNSSGGEEDAEY